ncbi:hypothetical protein [Corallococcus sp. EGB]|uniref:hypothetical protein n=1 Tax=Corallococcus sp. EGB TaxID=1521117 RepID=UPI001CBF1813|nr:hypothetical protein [Corallococcus sp. EGB]
MGATPGIAGGVAVEALAAGGTTGAMRGIDAGATGGVTAPTVGVAVVGRAPAGT